MEAVIEKYFNKVGVYIDNANFLLTLKNLTGNKKNHGYIIDYASMIDYILRELKQKINYKKNLKLNLVRIYDGLIVDDYSKKSKKEKFIFSVSQKIKNKFKDVSVYPRFVDIRLKTKRVKGDDTLMASDILYDTLTRSCDFIVIISGDGDFNSVIKIIRNKVRIPVIIAFFTKNLNHNLQKNADIFIEINTKIDEVKQE